MESSVSLLPGVAAPGVAVVSGAWLVAEGHVVPGGALGLLGLAAWTHAARLRAR
ncbi:MAG: hypothetical protein ABEJ79_10470 [Halolamina sp.]